MVVHSLRHGFRRATFLLERGKTQTNSNLTLPGNHSILYQKGSETGMAKNDVMLTYILLNGRSGHEAGRELLAELYRKATGENHPPIAVSPRGKPVFPGSPWHFSISHTKRHAFCAMAKCPVGIDAEETDRRINPKLAEKVLSPSEKFRFDRCSDKNDAFLRLWVLKEASVKLTGEGLKGYPNHTDFSPDDPRIQIIDGCYVAVLTE